MNPVLMSFLLIVALGFFSYTMFHKIRLLASLEPANRFDHIKERLFNLVTLAIGQKRLIGRAKERSSGLMHAFIFWGFCILLVRSLHLYAEGFSQGSHLPFFSEDYLLGYLYIGLNYVYWGNRV